MERYECIEPLGLLFLLILGVIILSMSLNCNKPSQETIVPLVRTIELNVAESEEVELCDGTKRSVKLIALDEIRDKVRNAVRKAIVTIEIDGQLAELTSATYCLPKTVANTQIDCPITKGYLSNNNRDAWGLKKDVRLRLWPAGSPLMIPGSFGYPLKQKWFASSTQMANEPTYVDGGEDLSRRRIYYHWGLDFGGAEGMVDVISATDGTVISAGDSVLPGYSNTPVSPRYDVVYILDNRGWYYRYSHLQSIDKSIHPGLRVNLGHPVGILGKEGGSGGWSHLHFDITCKQPSGKWGCHEAYALVWEAYQQQYKPDLVAVARPHQLLQVGEKIILDASRSWSRHNKITHYNWTFTDGASAEGEKVERSYSVPGTYSEILEIIDEAGRKDYDFCIVNVLDPDKPKQLPPTIHVVYAPTFGIQAGDLVTFKVRTFRTTDGAETIDFGDGSPQITVHSDGNVDMHAVDGYAVTNHRFSQPGHYIVRTERSNNLGLKATGHVHVSVGEAVKSGN
jgi:murein DD-endopeptidase MepM/ murein hydrolase activator NlpD